MELRNRFGRLNASRYRPGQPCSRWLITEAPMTVASSRSLSSEQAIYIGSCITSSFGAQCCVKRCRF